MEGIQCGSCGWRNEVFAAPVLFQGEAARLAGVRLTAEESADIDILTAEGDKVTLSSDYRLEANQLTYAHLAYNRSGFTAEQGELLDLREERRTAIYVEGSLSDEELADIEALMNDLGQIFQSALTGGPAAEDGAEEQGLTLGRYGSLSAVEVEFEARASVEIMTAASDRLILESASTPGTRLPSAVARSATPVQAAPAPPQPPFPNSAVNPAADDLLTENEHTARRMAQRVHDSGLEPLRFMQRLKKYLRGLLREMQSNQAIDSALAARGENLLEKFFARIEPPSNAEESKGTESVSLSLKTQQVRFSSYAYDFKAEVKLHPVLEETA